MDSTMEYVSVAPNRVQHCISMKDNILIYGACNAIVMAKFNHSEKSWEVVKSVVGHTDRVNCIRWICNDFFLTGSTDNNLCLWNKECEILNNFIGHESSVTSVDGSMQDNVIVSASADSTMRIWTKNKSDEWQCAHVFPCPKSGFVLDLAMVRGGDNIPWIFASFDDCVIRVFTFDSNVLTCCHTLRGHEDWSQTLSVTIEPKTSDILLASGSQDSFVRVWRFAKVDEERALAEQRQVSDLGQDEDIKAKEVIFSTKESKFFAVTIETVLSGHEDKVFGLQFFCSNEGRNFGLLTASLDKTIILWRLPDRDNEDDAEDLWLESLRVGEVGGNTLGFLGCQINQSGDLFVGYSFNGAIHSWHYTDSSWKTGVVPGGHYGPVEDLDWDPKGRYLITTSKDQTTRIHALWKNQFWHEIARPQVHGYDLVCLAMIGANHRLASGAEEKLVRVFEATSNFIENISAITNNFDQFTGDQEFLTAQGASVPSLGLSNKAVLDAKKGETEIIPETEKHVKDQFPDFYFKPEVHDKPPPEETLVQNTLWPEFQKLYGHGYEIFSIAANHSGSLLVSACKAAQSEHANIIVWQTGKWTKVANLQNGHTLTVVQMAFSPNDKYLLSVSRDRTLSLWNMDDYSLVFKTDKKTSIHQRIIWTCDWSIDSKYFVTGGRDKKCVIWSVEDQKTYSIQPLTFHTAVTAVAFAPIKDQHVVVAGLENGELYVSKYNAESGWSTPKKIEQQSHHKTIKRIKFRPTTDDADLRTKFLLATCGLDHFVQVISINFSES